MTANWNIEIYLYLTASVLALISVLTIAHKYRQTKNHFFLYLMISWSFLMLYILLGGIALLIQSMELFKFEILLLIPSAFFLVLVFDKLTRYSLDPIKMLIFGFFSAGVLTSSIMDDSVIEIINGAGFPSFQTNGRYHLGLSLFTGLVGFLFLYYNGVIFLRSPPDMKRRASLSLLGGIFFSPVSFIFYITRLNKLIPGIMLLSLAIGVVLPSLSYQLEPRLLDVLIEAENEARIRRLSKTLPICAHCKKIRDEKDQWQPFEEYLRRHSKILFSHGLCPDCIRDYYGDIVQNS